MACAKKSGVEVVVEARQRQGEQPLPVAPDHENRSVLAATVVLLVRHPRPHDLAGVRQGTRVGGVLHGGHPGVVAGVAREGFAGAG